MAHRRRLVDPGLSEHHGRGRGEVIGLERPPTQRSNANLRIVLDGAYSGVHVSADPIELDSIDDRNLIRRLPSTVGQTLSAAEVVRAARTGELENLTLARKRTYLPREDSMFPLTERPVGQMPQQHGDSVVISVPCQRNAIKIPSIGSLTHLTEAKTLPVRDVVDLSEEKTLPVRGEADLNEAKTLPIRGEADLNEAAPLLTRDSGVTDDPLALPGMDWIPWMTDGTVPENTPISSLRNLGRALTVKRRYRQLMLQEDRVHKRRTRRVAAKEEANGCCGINWRGWELWGNGFRDIESQFGSAIASYFSFVKWLLFLNIFILILMFCTVVGPHIILPAQSYTDYAELSCGTWKTKWCGNETSAREAVNLSTTCSELYQTQLKGGGSSKLKLILNDVAALFTGTGWVSATGVFYGSYYNQTFAVQSWTNTSEFFRYDYPMGVAFVGSTCFYLIISLACVIIHSGQSFKQNILAAKDTYNQFVFLTLTGWDHSMSDGKSVEMRKWLLYRTLKSLVSEELRQIKQLDMGIIARSCLLLRRIVINLLCLAIVIGAIAAVFSISACKSMITEYLGTNMGQFGAVVGEFVPSLTLAALNSITPTMFFLIGRAEAYSPSTHVQLTLLRTVVVRFTGVLFLIVPLLGFDLVFRGHLGFCHLSKGNSSVTLESEEMQCRRGHGSVNEALCPETDIGQALYKLMLTEMVVAIAVTFLYHWPRRLFHDYFGTSNKLIQMINRKEFDLPVEVIALIYCQTIYWCATYFSPVMPVMAVVHCVLYFYMKKWNVLNNCRQPQQIYEAKLAGFFSFLLIAGIFMALMVLGYVISVSPASVSCGAFRLSGEKESAWQGIEHYINDGTVSNAVYHFVNSVMVQGVVLLTLTITIVGLLSHAAASKRAVGILKQQLRLDAADKRFFVRLRSIEWRRLRLIRDRDRSC